MNYVNIKYRYGHFLSYCLHTNYNKVVLSSSQRPFSLHHCNPPPFFAILYSPPSFSPVVIICLGFKDTYTSSEGSKLIRHRALSLLDYLWLGRVLLLQWNHTHTHTHTHTQTLHLRDSVGSRWASVRGCCFVCVLQCVCITPGLWVFREIVEFLS